MTDEVLENFVRKYIAAQPEGTREINFTWQGGEPTLMGIDFFQKAVEFQQKYARPNMAITNSFQTNGTLLNDDWGRFFNEVNFLVGLSVDGPEELHNKFRPDKKGAGSFKAVMHGLEVLKRHSVRFNTLTCVQSHNGDFAEGIYLFLKKIGSRFLQFIPIVEQDNAGKVTPQSVRPEQYGRFLSRIFDCWLHYGDVGEVFIQNFEVTLNLWMGYPSPVCVHAETCGLAAAIEHDGSIYSCDHFVTRENQIGSVIGDSIVEIMESEHQRTFGRDKKDKLPNFCRNCQFLKVCNGGCPKDRFRLTPDGEEGLNYLCEGYKIYYDHTVPVFELMADCLKKGIPASRYKIIAEAQGAGDGGVSERVGRNAPCPCGSGKKYKKCCGKVG